MEIGAWNKLPHYSVHGDKTKMYIWVNEDGYGSSSAWISGREAFNLWSRLALLRKKSKAEFINELKLNHLKFQKKKRN